MPTGLITARRALLVATSGLALATQASCTPAPRAVCSDFSSQLAAQQAGAGRDGDGDGAVCESLPCPCVKGLNKPRPKTGPARVEKVIDGDTVRVRLLKSGERATVRLIGIDAPESSSLRFGHAECGGREATGYLKQYAAAHPDVMVRHDPTQDPVDRYGRTLALVDPRDGAPSYQAAMLAAGFASSYVYERPGMRTTAFQRLAADAAQRRSGVWRLCGGFHANKKGPRG